MISPPRNTRPLTPRQIRITGWVLIGIGLFLTVFMGWITVIVINIMIHSDDPDATTRFTGGLGMKAFTFGIFGVVIAFGLIAILNGGWQVRYSKRNPHFIRWLLWLASALGAFGILAAILDSFD